MQIWQKIILAYVSATSSSLSLLFFWLDLKANKNDAAWQILEKRRLEKLLPKAPTTHVKMA